MAFYRLGDRPCEGQGEGEHGPNGGSRSANPESHEHDESAADEESSVMTDVWPQQEGSCPSVSASTAVLIAPSFASSG